MLIASGWADERCNRADLNLNARFRKINVVVTFADQLRDAMEPSLMESQPIPVDSDQSLYSEEVASVSPLSVVSLCADLKLAVTQVKLGKGRRGLEFGQERGQTAALHGARHEAASARLQMTSSTFVWSFCLLPKLSHPHAHPSGK
jgi:hypothetical protein